MTGTEFARNRDNFCYRHPDRVSFVLCQRCLRTICSECQTQAPVGVICPECMKKQRSESTPAQRRAHRRWGTAARSEVPRATYAIIAVTAVVGLLQLIPELDVSNWLAFYAPLVDIAAPAGYFQPWRVLSVVLVHASVLHFLMNMLSLWMIGRILEPMIGATRFTALYAISGIGGSVLSALLAPGTPVVGASGAVFGLLGALVVIVRRFGGDITGILVVLGLNLAIGFMPGMAIAWQAHLGGVVAGALVGWLYFATQQRSRRLMQILGLAAIAAVLLALVFIVPGILR